MDEIRIKSNSWYYPIYIGFNIAKSLDKLIKDKYSAVLIITDENVAKLYLDEIRSNLKRQKVFTNIIQPGEKSKSIDRSEEHTSELQSRFDLVCRLLL